MAELAITITLRPAVFRHSIKKQYDLLHNAVLDCPFFVSLVAELTNSGNLHAHGIVSEFRDTTYGSFKQYVIEHFRSSKVIGFICLKEMDNRAKWFNYCLKNYKETKKDLYFANVVIINENVNFPHGLDLIQIVYFDNDQKVDCKDIVLCNDCLVDHNEA